MLLNLTDDQVAELSNLLESALSDLGYQLAATDSRAYRVALASHRDRLSAIARLLATTEEDGAAPSGGVPVELYGGPEDRDR